MPAIKFTARYLRITALFVRALSGFTSTSSRTRNKKFNTAQGAAECSVKFRVSCS